jgi:hypothetical protein
MTFPRLIAEPAWIGLTALNGWLPFYMTSGNFVASNGNIQWAKVDRDAARCQPGGYFLFDHEPDLSTPAKLEAGLTKAENAMNKAAARYPNKGVMAYDVWGQGIQSPEWPGGPQGPEGRITGDDLLAGMQYPIRRNSAAITVAVYGGEECTVRQKIACGIDMAAALGRPCFALVWLAEDLNRIRSGVEFAIQQGGRWNPSKRIDGIMGVHSMNTAPAYVANVKEGMAVVDAVLKEKGVVN